MASFPQGLLNNMFIWPFPKIGVPRKSSILVGFSPINHPSLGTPIPGNPHIVAKYHITPSCYPLEAFFGSPDCTMNITAQTKPSRTCKRRLASECQPQIGGAILVPNNHDFEEPLHYILFISPGLLLMTNIIWIAKIVVVVIIIIINITIINSNIIINIITSS